MGRRMNDGNIGEGAEVRRSEECAGRSSAMTRRRVLALSAGLVGLSATPGFATSFVNTIGPRANHIVVSKSGRSLELRRGEEILRRYRVDLGFTPQGHKTRSGDGRTPEGRYWIDRRNPRSEYYLSIGITYPDVDDVARARAQGVDPGGDIFIHGEPMRSPKRTRRDWTAGCIAVTNREIEEIWALTPTGVPITIFA